MSNILRQRLEAGQSVYADHPAADTLAAFIEHSLKNTERDKVLSHLSACSECRQAVMLAVPEVAEAVRVQAPHSSPWYFPTAMRWASLTAAVAVAVGVGMISYEHEFGSKSSSYSAESKPQNVAKEQKSEVASSAPTAQTTLQDTFGKNQPKPATVREPKIAESRSELASKLSRKDADRVLELDQKAQTRDSSAGVLGGIVSGSKTQSSNAVGAELGKQQSPATANFVSGGLMEQPPVPSRSESMKALPAVTAAAPAPASPTATAHKSAASAFTDSNEVKATSGDLSLDQTAASGSAGGFYAANGTVPNKVPGFTALNGPVKKSAAAVTEFASWTVTAAGKLQRRLRNGAVNFIEPAPGLIVHAVASRGIEVWAGGSQPDAPKQGPQSALFHSSDAGESWKQVNGPWHGPINQLALSGPDTLTVVTDDGTWVSNDAGGSWSNR